MAKIEKNQDKISPLIIQKLRKSYKVLPLKIVVFVKMLKHLFNSYTWHIHNKDIHCDKNTPSGKFLEERIFCSSLDK